MTNEQTFELVVGAPSILWNTTKHQLDSWLAEESRRICVLAIDGYGARVSSDMLLQIDEEDGRATWKKQSRSERTAAREEAF